MLALRCTRLGTNGGIVSMPRSSLKWAQILTDVGRDRFNPRLGNEVGIVPADRMNQLDGFGSGERETNLPESSVGTELRDGDVVGSIDKRSTVPHQLRPLRIARVVVEVDCVIIFAVDRELAQSSIGLLLGQVGDSDSDERECDGCIRRVRIRCDRERKENES